MRLYLKDKFCLKLSSNNKEYLLINLLKTQFKEKIKVLIKLLTKIIRWFNKEITSIEQAFNRLINNY